MKIILCASIVFICGIIGITIRNVFYKKHQLFSEINAFLHFILIKIAFFQDVYADCLLNFIKTNKLKNHRVFSDMHKLVKQSNLNKKDFQSCVAKLGLSQTEEDELYNIFNSIGTTDILNQKSIIESNIKHIEYKLVILSEQKKSKGDVASKLSICIGLAICILIY